MFDISSISLSTSASEEIPASGKNGTKEYSFSLLAHFTRLHEYSLVPFFPDAGISSDAEVDKDIEEMVTQILRI